MKYKNEIDLLVHFILGIICAFFNQLLLFWILYVIFFKAILPIFKINKVSLNLFSIVGYVISMEMMVRMSDIGLPHELMKYFVFFFFFISLIRQNSKSIPNLIIVYFLLLMPSILVMDNHINFNDWRQNLSFNLSGPLAIMISTIYFYRKSITVSDLKELFHNLLLPIISTTGYLFIKTPKVENVIFTHGANFAMSGYGPNQMSSLLGVGVLIILISIIYEIKIYNLPYINYIILILLIYRGLLTFSRGGMMGPIVSITLGFLYYLLKSGISIKSLKLIAVTSFFAIFIIFTFLFVNNLTDNTLYERYFGLRDGETVDFNKYSSGRAEIQDIDLEIFNDNIIFGVGPGMAKELRVEYGYAHAVAAHSEIYRMFSEHGLFGIFSLLFLILEPIKYFLSRNRNSFSNFLLLVFIAYFFSFIVHSATRIALPMFLYGLAFANFKTNDLRKSEFV